jgi:hypothetical protein
MRQWDRLMFTGVMKAHKFGGGFRVLRAYFCRLIA